MSGCGIATHLCDVQCEVHPHAKRIARTRRRDRLDPPDSQCADFVSLTAESAVWSRYGLWLDDGPARRVAVWSMGTSGSSWWKLGTDGRETCK